MKEQQICSERLGTFKRIWAGLNKNHTSHKYLDKNITEKHFSALYSLKMCQPTFYSAFLWPTSWLQYLLHKKRIKHASYQNFLFKKCGPNTTPTTQVITNSTQKMTASSCTQTSVFLLCCMTSSSPTRPGAVPYSLSGCICCTRRLTVGRMMKRVSLLSPSRESTTLWVTVARRVGLITGRRKVSGGSLARMLELQGKERASPASTGVRWRQRGHGMAGGPWGSGGSKGQSWILWRHSVQKTCRHSSIRGHLLYWLYSW